MIDALLLGWFALVMALVSCGLSFYAIYLSEMALRRASVR